MSAEQRDARADASAELAAEQLAHCGAQPIRGGQRGDVLSQDTVEPFRTELAKLEGELEKARNENHVLLAQLQQVQHELERCHVVRKRAAETHPAQPRPYFSAEVVSVGEARETPPHRELPMVLRGMRAGDRDIRDQFLRLIEHHGRAGLVIFERNGRQLLDGWRESGKEDDKPYALLIPSDKTTGPCFESLSASDWKLLQSLVPRVQQAVAGAERQHSARWAMVARRLYQELLDLPARLRFDSLETSLLARSGVFQALDLRFTGVTCAGHELRHLHLHWRVGGGRRSGMGGASIAVLRAGTDEDIPLLGSWPLAEDGSLAPSLNVSLGEQMAMREKRRQWSVLGRANAEFVYGILRALPLVASRLPDETLPAGWSRQALSRAAARLPSEGRQLRRSPRWQHLARVLLDAIPYRSERDDT